MNCNTCHGFGTYGEKTCVDCTDRCEHCHGKVSSYRLGCPTCGAPMCCQDCCLKQPVQNTCKFCSTPATYYGFICDKCKPIYQAGEREGKNFIIKELQQRLLEDVRLLNDLKIK